MVTTGALIQALDAVISHSYWCVTAVLLVGGTAKLITQADFRKVIRELELVPQGLTPATAFSVPVVEVGLALWLASGIAAGVAALSAALTFLSFAGIIAHQLRRGGGATHCGCFGVRASLTWRSAARDVLLAVWALAPLTPQPAMWLLFSGAGMGCSFLSLSSSQATTPPQTPPRLVSSI